MNLGEAKEPEEGSETGVIVRVSTPRGCPAKPGEIVGGAADRAEKSH